MSLPRGSDNLLAIAKQTVTVLQL